MNVTGKTEAVKAWLGGCPELGEYLKLNATEMQSGEVSMLTDYNTATLREFIDGSKERAYTFGVALVKSWSSGFDGTNAEAMQFGEALADWLANQYAAGNVPDLGEGCEVVRIEPLQNVPTLSNVQQDEQLARYTFQARIIYREKE